MPPDMLSIYGTDDRETRRVRAWEAHYIRKGCAPFKAWCVARRKCRHAATWPPINL